MRETTSRSRWLGRLAGSISMLFACELVAASPLAAADRSSKIERRIDGMAAEQKVGQLLMVTFEGTADSPELHEMVTGWGVGGVLFLGRNLTTPEQTRALTSDIRKLAAASVIPFLAIDHEGGTVLRLREGAPALPGNMALGAAGSSELAFAAGAEVGRDLRELGFTMNLAPVLDVYSNPRSDLGTRTFGDEPELAARLGSAFIDGQTSVGMVSVAKHFAGEGHAPGDSHNSAPVVNVSRQQLEACDLRPFRAVIAHGVPAIMTSHVAVPSLTGTVNLPVTLSGVALSNVLRAQLGFQGIVITDALQMVSILSRAAPADAALLAINAGADMVLTTGFAFERRAVFEALLRAYRDGRIPEERIRTSLRRILTIKDRFRTAAGPPAGQRYASGIAQRIANASITLIRGESALLPVRGTPIYVGPAGHLERLFANHVELPRRIETQAVPALVAAVVRAGASAGLIIGAAENSKQIAVLNEIAAALPGVPLVVISLGNPRDLERSSRARLLLAAYSTCDATQRAVASVLNGSTAARGTLPITSRLMKAAGEREMEGTSCAN